MYNRMWYECEFASDNDRETTNPNSSYYYRRRRCVWNRQSDLDSKCMCDRHLEMEHRSNKFNNHGRSRYLYGLL
jgi:hypothetical protein